METIIYLKEGGGRMGKIQKSLYYYNSITTMGSYHDRNQEEKGFLSGWLFLLFSLKYRPPFQVTDMFQFPQ